VGAGGRNQGIVANGSRTQPTTGKISLHGKTCHLSCLEPSFSTTPLAGSSSCCCGYLHKSWYKFVLQHVVQTSWNTCFLEVKACADIKLLLRHLQVFTQHTAQRLCKQPAHSLGPPLKFHGNIVRADCAILAHFFF